MGEHEATPQQHLSLRFCGFRGYPREEGVEQYRRDCAEVCGEGDDGHCTETEEQMCAAAGRRQSTDNGWEGNLRQLEGK